MSKKLAFLTIALYLTIAGVIFSVSAIMKEKPVKASIYPVRIFAGQTITYSDSTEDAKVLLWDFGNGSRSRISRGTCEFPKAGNYEVVLTVNNKKQVRFPVQVKEPELVYKKDSSVFIYAHSSGIVGQKIHFKAMGNGIDWYEWYFGESGKIDARASETFYSFKKPGTYEIKLITNLNYHKPEKHLIKIVSQYEVTENVVLDVPNKNNAGGGGGGGASADDLLVKLQEIARGSNFSSNYKYIVSKYLCSNPNAPVVVNQSQISDFYSYCQNLQLKSGQVILSVDKEMRPGSKCVSRLLIKHK